MIIFGILAIVYGIYVYSLKEDETKLPKLKAMREKHGEEKGTRIHFLFYVVAPIVVGLVMLSMGLQQISR